MGMRRFSHALNLLLHKRCIHNRLADALRIAVLARFMFMGPFAQAQTMWCPADLNQDHEVSAPDLALLLVAWGSTLPSDPDDLNRDGQVDGQDLGLMLLEQGPCAPTISPNTAYALCEFVDTIGPPNLYPLTPGWSIIWKPDVSIVGSCYAIVLQATAPAQSSGDIMLLPMYAIAIQGTQNAADVVFDMAVTPQLAFDPIENAQIGKGSNDALNCVLNLVQTTSGVTQSLQEFIESLSTDDQLFVTGHSLGGNITSVLTPWIAFNVPAFGGSMLPLTYLPHNLSAMTFAAPTAGNLEFATFLNNNPISYQAFFNSNDVVPNAWATTGALNLNRINNDLYSQDVPTAVSGLLVTKKLEMARAGVAYTQTNGTIFTFPLGPTDGTSQTWLWQVGYQHNNAYCAQFLGSVDCAPPSNFISSSVTNSELKRLVSRRTSPFLLSRSRKR